MAKLLASIRSVCSKEAFNMETNPLDVVRALGPSLVPFFKTVAIYFVLARNIANRPLFAVIKCLPVLSLIAFVAMHYRTRLAPKKMGDLRKLQLLHFDSVPRQRPQRSSSVDSVARGSDSEQTTAAASDTESSASSRWQGIFDRSSDDVLESIQPNAEEQSQFQSPQGIPAKLSGTESRYAKLVLIGLLLSLAGDVCLVWSPQLFLHGLLLFALAHCAYAAAFSFTPINPLGFLFVLVVGIAYYSVMRGYFLGIYAVAAPCYTVLIGTMWWRAISRLKLGASFWEWTAIASCFGATLFAVSDALLGISHFSGGFAYVDTLIMVTYYAAQFGIAVSVVDTYRDAPSSSVGTKDKLN